jgi:membrane protease YdiL (CAAX protease family)
MDGIKSLVMRHPLVTYFILAYALTWVLAPLLTISLLLGVVGLLMPAVAAIVVTALTEGKPGVTTLLQRLKLWRVGLRWYVVALGLPMLLSAAVVALSILLGAPAQVEFSPVSLLTMVVFVLVVGEEIGWRGYALPKLLQNYSAVTASLILGVLWGGWHLPTFFIAGSPQASIPFVAFLLFTTGASVLFTWLHLHTGGSLLIATLFHGAINSFGFVNNALDPASRWWLTGTVYIAAAIIVSVIAGLNLGRRPTAQGEAEPVAAILNSPS